MPHVQKIENAVAKDNSVSRSAFGRRNIADFLQRSDLVVRLYLILMRWNGQDVLLLRWHSITAIVPLVSISSRNEIKYSIGKA